MTLELVARCVRGLEWVLAAEIAGLADCGDPQPAERQVSFTALRPDPALLALRTADDLLLDIGSASGVDHTRAGLAALPGRLGRLDFGHALDQLRTLRKLPDRPRFDIVASLLGQRNYNRYAVEDAAGPVIAGILDARYVSRSTETPGTRQTADTDLTIRLFLHGPDVQAALRIPARPLHRRVWKQATGPGTLHPPLAAALARIGAPARSGEARTFVAVDPFCGDGTLPIELALARPTARVLAADLDPQRLANAHDNALRADAHVQFVRADAGRPAWRPASVDLVITNPPWNRAVGAAGSLADTLDPLWSRLPEVLAPRGRICTIADVELGIAEQLRARGYTVALAQSVRLAGRVSQVLLATPPDAEPARLPADLAHWRDRALATGLISPTGF
jgi:tRNA (guanine6-N2)-methyltransferase